MFLEFSHDLSFVTSVIVNILMDDSNLPVIDTPALISTYSIIDNGVFTCRRRVGHPPAKLLAVIGPSKVF